MGSSNTIHNPATWPCSQCVGHAVLSGRAKDVYDTVSHVHPRHSQSPHIAYLPLQASWKWIFKAHTTRRSMSAGTQTVKFRAQQQTSTLHISLAYLRWPTRSPAEHCNHVYTLLYRSSLRGHASGTLITTCPCSYQTTAWQSVPHSAEAPVGHQGHEAYR